MEVWQTPSPIFELFRNHPKNDYSYTPHAIFMCLCLPLVTKEQNEQRGLQSAVLMLFKIKGVLIGMGKIENKRRNRASTRNTDVEMQLVSLRELDDYKHGTTLYNPSFSIVARNVCTYFGANKKELAKTFGVSENVISCWIKKYPAFKDSIAIGVDNFTVKRVEKKLLKRALGYTYKEETTFFGKDKLYASKKIVQKHIPPDLSAIKLLLTNRDPERWAEKREVHTIDDNYVNDEIIKKLKKETGAWQEVLKILSQTRKDLEAPIEVTCEAVETINQE